MYILCYSGVARQLCSSESRIKGEIGISVLAVVEGE
jgi:hypothetical protein